MTTIDRNAEASEVVRRIEDDHVFPCVGPEAAIHIGGGSVKYGRRNVAFPCVFFRAQKGFDVGEFREEFVRAITEFGGGELEEEYGPTEFGEASSSDSGWHVIIPVGLEDEFVERTVLDALTRMLRNAADRRESSAN